MIGDAIPLAPPIMEKTEKNNLMDNIIIPQNFGKIKGICKNCEIWHHIHRPAAGTDERKRAEMPPTAEEYFERRING